MGSKRHDPDWEELYRGQEVETMPWFFTGLDPDFEAALEEHGLSGGKVLDLCTGPGTQAIALADMGFEVHATDISATAVRQAREKAQKKGLAIDFQQADILEDELGEDFDIVIDRGCFHVFEPEQRDGFVRAVARVLKPGGWLLLKCFSQKEKRREGPYRFKPEQLRQYFSVFFEIISTVDAVFNGTLDKYPKTLFSVMRRKA